MGIFSFLGGKKSEAPKAEMVTYSATIAEPSFPTAQAKTELMPQNAVGDADAGTLSFSEMVEMLDLGAKTSAGVSVNADSALRVATVYRCVELIGSSIKMLPFKVYERKEDAHIPKDHDYNFLFNIRACPDMSSSDAWQYLITSKFFYGDGFAELVRKDYRSSEILYWQPLHPLRCEPFRDKQTGIKYYRVTDDDGGQRVLTQSDIIQLPSLGYDGLRSPSPITYAAKEAIGSAIAGSKWAGEFFTSGGQFDFALSTDARMGSQQLKDLKQNIMQREQNSRWPLILSGGLKPAQLSINPKDAEILSSRLFDIEEICRIFGVPPHMVGHTQKSTSWQSGLEEMGANFKRFTLMNHITQIKQEFNYKLFSKRSALFMDFDTSELERSDMKTRYEAYRSALGRAGEPGWLKVNEVRKRENLPPDDDGDKLFNGNAEPEQEAEQDNNGVTENVETEPTPSDE
ncbi:portal protein [Vibrio phage Vaitephage]|nr:portal protein [Vibrio phage Fayden]WCD55654.1 portal protein [Vibrio phage Vaitephage]